MYVCSDEKHGLLAPVEVLNPGAVIVENPNITGALDPPVPTQTTTTPPGAYTMVHTPYTHTYYI